MEEVILHSDSKGHPIDIHLTGEQDRPVSAYVLLANVPADPPGMILLTYGNSDSIGNMLMSMYQRCVHDDPKTAWAIEQVARGIIVFADGERDKWPDGGLSGRA